MRCSPAARLAGHPCYKILIREFLVVFGRIKPSVVCNEQDITYRRVTTTGPARGTHKSRNVLRNDVTRDAVASSHLSRQLKRPGSHHLALNSRGAGFQSLRRYNWTLRRLVAVIVTDVSNDSSTFTPQHSPCVRFFRGFPQSLQDNVDNLISVKRQIC